MTLQPTTFLYAVWSASIVAKLVLLVVVLALRRYRTFPLFSSYSAFIVAKSLVLLWYSFHDERGGYFYPYYLLSILESLWTIAIVYEVFDKVFSRQRVRRAGLMRAFLTAYAITGTVLVSLAALNIHAYPLRVMAMANAAERTAVFVAFGGFAATAFFGVWLKVPWRPHAFGIGAGFLIELSVNAVATSIIATEFRAIVAVLRYVPMFGTLLALVAWIKYLTTNEPELRAVGRETLEELRNFLARAEIPPPDQMFAKSNTVND